MGFVHFIENRLRQLPNWRKGSCLSDETSETIGKWGEKIAISFLRKQGYKVLVKRYRTKQGEIDVVCRHDETLVFVEVKARSGLDLGRPSEFVTVSKQRKLTKAALDYLRLLGNPPIYFRFDVVEVELQDRKKPSCSLIRNAFELPEPYLY